MVIRGLAKAESRVRISLVALIDTYSNLLLKMIEDPCVIGSSPILRPNGAVSSIGRATYYIDVSSLWLCSVVVIASACHAEDHEFDSRQSRSRLISGIRQLDDITKSCSR